MRRLFQFEALNRWLASSASLPRGFSVYILLSVNRDGLVMGLTLVGSLCWIVCFWWMHRISTKQNALLQQLREQGKRIEKLSKIEHDLIKEVHPQVGEIKEGQGCIKLALLSRSGPLVA